MNINLNIAEANLILSMIDDNMSSASGLERETLRNIVRKFNDNCTGKATQTVEEYAIGILNYDYEG